MGARGPTKEKVRHIKYGAKVRRFLKNVDLIVHDGGEGDAFRPSLPLSVQALAPCHTFLFSSLPSTSLRILHD